MTSAALAYVGDVNATMPDEAVATPRPAKFVSTRPVSRRLHWPIFMSVVLHAAAAAAIMPWATSETGTRETPTEAISIELVSSNVVEQAVAEQSNDAQRSLAATSVQDGDAVETVAAAAAADEVMAIEPPEPVAENKPVPASEEIQSVIAGEGAESDVAVEEPKIKAQEPARATDRTKHAETKRSKTPAKATEEGRTAETRVKGGVASRGSADRAASGGRVSASAGSIAGYASRVRARVAANKPSASGRGTAVISFHVTSGGGLSYARLARSSGVAAIDQAALAAVRRSAPFPTPPAGASPGQLAFTIPFHFR